MGESGVRISRVDINMLTDDTHDCREKADTLKSSVSKSPASLNAILYDKALFVSGELLVHIPYLL